jgi:hypothetical protein
VVATRDVGFFTLGRLPDAGGTRRTALELAARLREHLGDAEMRYGDVGAALGEPANRLRYAALTGTVVMRWDGARQPTIRVVAPPNIDANTARLELARRYLHVFGPATPASFARWAGIAIAAGEAAFDALRRSLVPVRSPIGDGWILRRDEETFREDPPRPASARLLPSGDTWFLLQGEDRELLVPDATRRGALWTSRVWPGAVLVAGEVVGTWRRADERVSVSAWGRLTKGARTAVEAEAATLPLPGRRRGIEVSWEG